MAELLVRVVSKTNEDDHYKDVKLLKRGDVVVVLADDWPWTVIERQNPEWRILKWPNISIEAAERLLLPEIPEEPPVLPELPDPSLQARRFYLNLDDPWLPLDMQVYLADDTRVNPFYVMPEHITMADIKLTRPRRPDPAVIGV